MEMVDLKDHKKSKIRITDKRRRLKLIDNVVEANIFDENIYENDYFDDRLWKLVDRLNKRNGRKMKKGSINFRVLKKAILSVYLKLALKLIIDTLMKGERIILFKYVFAMHITELPTFRKFGSFLKYKYIHAFNGVYPVIRVAIGQRLLYSMAIMKKVHHRVMRLDAFYYKEMSSMISYKIEVDRMKFSKEWETIINSKKLKS